MNSNGSFLRQSDEFKSATLNDGLNQMTVEQLTTFFLEEEKEKTREFKNNASLNTPSLSDSDISILDTASQSFKSSNAKRAKTHQCPYVDCLKLFTRPSILTEHVQIKHLNIRKYKCDECGMAYTKKLHLQRHYLSSHAIDDKPFACSFCEKKVLTKQHLQTHERTHTKPCKCDFNDQCDASFTTAKLLESHIQRAHISQHEEKLTCHFCKKKYQSPSKLNQHVIKEHNSAKEFDNLACKILDNNRVDKNLLNLQKTLKQKRYLCTTHECNKSFNTWSLYQQHMKNDHPKLQCLICTKKCVGEQGLQMHMMIHDETMSNKIWKCLICENKFAKKLELILHCKDIHEVDIDQNKQLATKVDKKKEQSTDYLSAGIGSNNSEDSSLISVKKNVKKTDLDLWKSNIKILNKIDNGDSMAEVLLSSIGKKYECRIKNCYRKFKRKENFETHLKKHKEYVEKMALITADTTSVTEETLN
ncbi:hypothetical protein QEN19_000827 [Hanseniaspora menglaensis]